MPDKSIYELLKKAGQKIDYKIQFQIEHLK